MDIDSALIKLNALLPLHERQKNLTDEARVWHRNILSDLAYIGKVPTDIPMSTLKSLHENDLIVLNSKVIVGAYPFSLRKTDHRIFNDDIDLYAMCAFDAIAIAPLFLININIHSHCYVTNEAIQIYQEGEQLVQAKPSIDIYVGIRWQSAGSCSADSLCMEMIFLKDKKTALAWLGDSKDISVFTLTDAMDFAVKYFKPLL